MHHARGRIDECLFFELGLKMGADYFMANSLFLVDVFTSDVRDLLSEWSDLAVQILVDDFPVDEYVVVVSGTVAAEPLDDAMCRCTADFHFVDLGVFAVEACVAVDELQRDKVFHSWFFHFL